MKIAPSNNRPKKKPLLPLVPEEDDELDSSNSVSYNLRVEPTNTDSPTYKKHVRVLAGGESVRACIQWSRDSDTVLKGLNISGAQATYDLLRNLLTGSALALLELKVTEQCQAEKNRQKDNESDDAAKARLEARSIILFITDQCVRKGKQAVMEGLIPNKIVAMVKRYLRRECYKPADMKIRVYYQHLLRINDSELTLLPPFKPSQNLPPDEIVDILICATPKSWLREMDRQGFDPISKSPIQVIDFMERIEQAEDFDGQIIDRQQKTSANGKSKKKQKTKGDSHGSKFCLKHGKCNHTSDECA